MLLTGILLGERDAITYVTVILVSGIPTGIIGFAGWEFFQIIVRTAGGCQSPPCHPQYFPLHRISAEKADQAINREKCTPDRFHPWHRHCPGYFESGATIGIIPGN